jgi:hypothetical protein
MKAEAIAAIAVTLFVGTGVMAQGQTLATEGQPLVTVHISNVADNIAPALHVEAGKVPATVRVPVELGAQVCGVPATALAPAPGGAAQCTATRSSPALVEAVRSQMKG